MAKTNNSFDFEKITVKNRYGSKTKFCYAISQMDVAKNLVNMNFVEEDLEYLQQGFDRIVQVWNINNHIYNMVISNWIINHNCLSLLLHHGIIKIKTFNFNNLDNPLARENNVLYKALSDETFTNMLCEIYCECPNNHKVLIRRALSNVVLVIQEDNIRKMRRIPSMDWVKIETVCIEILYNAGILVPADTYTQIIKMIGNKANLPILSKTLNELNTLKELSIAFEVFADRWILHEFKDTYHIANQRIDESIVKTIATFVSENAKYIEGRFHYDFQLRSLADYEDETKGESTADSRESVIHGKVIDDNGDTNLSEFELNDIYLASEASYAQDKIDSTGYHNPKIIGLILARMFNPYIIVKSMEKVVGHLTIEEAEAYLSHRGNDVLLENLQNAQDLWDEFHENFDFSDKSPREAFKELINFLHINSNLLTEEGLAVLKCLQTYISPMLTVKGVYERTIKDGLETIVTYDMFFTDQLNRFGQLMAEPHALPATVRAFLVDSMYGAGKRRIATDLYETDEISKDLISELNKAFDRAYEVYNQDGGLDELMKQESERKSVDTQLANMSLDAIREAGGDEAVWEDFISDGIVDPTWEAILEIEGLGQI